MANILRIMIICVSVIIGLSSHVYAIDINHSCRFNDDDSAYLTRTPGASGNRRTWTFNTWVKRGNIGYIQYILTGYYNSNNKTVLRFDANDKLHAFSYVSGGYNFQYTSTDVFRDPTSWYNIHLRVDTTDGNASNRVKIYVNGSQLTAFDTLDTAATNHDTYINAPNAQLVNRDPQSPHRGLDGYLSGVYMIDGSALEPSSFGEFIDGVWSPKEYTGTYGTNGYYLDFSDSANLGNDTSGNNNHFTSNNLTTDDQVLDTPTNNYCTLNPVDAAGGTFSKGNLKVGTPAGEGRGRGTMVIPSSNRIYFEVTLANIGNAPFAVGFRPSGESISTSWIQSYDRIFYTRPGHSDNGIVWDGSAWSVSYGSPSQGDVIGFALYENKLWISINNSWLNSGDPSAGTGYVLDNLPDDILAAWFDEASSSSANFEFNFGQLGFQYTPPTGFKALCSKNTDLPVISEFTVVPNPIDYPNPSTLSWSVSNADSVDIEPDIGSVALIDSMSILPPGNKTYTLTATNANGTSTATVSVEVNGGYDASGNFTVFGNLGVGTINPQSKLEVNGTIKAKEVIVTLDGWPDFVFRENYDLPTLESVEAFIKKNNHLPGIPSETDIQSNGLPMAEILTKQMQKIEELTLYLIDLKNENEKLKNRITILEQKE